MSITYEEDYKKTINKQSQASSTEEQSLMQDISLLDELHHFWILGEKEEFFNRLRKAVELGEIDKKVLKYIASTLKGKNLSKVKNDIENLGYTIPKSYVGLGLRGRYTPHTKSSAGLIAHPAGYVLDYRAYDNPMIHSKNKKKSKILLSRQILLATFGTNNIQTEFGYDLKKINVGLGSRNNRRKKIEEMGRTGNLNSEYLNKMYEAYIRVSETSKNFKTSLPIENIKRLQKISLKSNMIYKTKKDLKKILKETMIKFFLSSNVLKKKKKQSINIKIKLKLL